MKLIAPDPGVRLAALSHEYSAKPLLTTVEGRFFRMLTTTIAADGVYIVCKPRLADFVQHSGGIAAFNRISQKHVDFLICCRTRNLPMLGIEVDDSSHLQPDRKNRDIFVNQLFAHIGVPLLRIQVQEIEQQEQVVEQLNMGWCKRLLHLDAVSKRNPPSDLS